VKAPDGKKKMSRNRARKAAYAAQADTSSRNQAVLDGPVVGHFEKVTEEEVIVTDEETGEIVRQFTRKLARPFERIVHDGPASDGPAAARTPKRATDARKRRRQIAAWSRCKALRETDAHRGEGNCGCCGCPPGEQATAKDAA
jgi:hypothetical protein